VVSGKGSTRGTLQHTHNKVLYKALNIWCGNLQHTHHKVHYKALNIWLFLQKEPVYGEH